MAARAIASGTISFGLVSIPVKLFTATASEQVCFNMLHNKCKGRMKQQYHCPTDEEIVPRSDMVKGYEYTKGQYVIFEAGELKALEADRSSALDIVEFVPLESVDFIHVEKTYYLGADKGGDKAYKLLSESMVNTAKVAVGRWAARGKEQLVLIRPYQGGLLLHQLYYSNEVRDFDAIDDTATFQFKDVERRLAEKLIEELSVDSFDPTQYVDDYAKRVMAAVDQKVAGQEVAFAPEVPKAQIIDLFEALKSSLNDATQISASADKLPAAKPATKSKRKKAETKAKSVVKAKPKPLKKAVPRKTTRSKKTG